MINRLNIELYGSYIGTRDEWLQEPVYEVQNEYIDSFALDLDIQTNAVLIEKGIQLNEPEFISVEEYERREREELQKIYDKFGVIN